MKAHKIFNLITALVFVISFFWGTVTVSAQELRLNPIMHTVTALDINVAVDKLAADNGAAGDNFGSAVARSGNLVIVGSPYTDIDANIDQGTAYVYNCNSLPCVQKAQLFASDGAGGDMFGGVVAANDELVIVGAIGNGGGAYAQGAAYVFDCSGSSCVETDKLFVTNTVRFGNVIAIHDNIVVVGSYLENYDTGAAYVFDCSDPTNCIQRTKLTAPDGWTNRWFGSYAAIDEMLIVVGAYAEDIGGQQDQGSAYVFRCNSTYTDCSAYTKLVAADGVALANFGRTVAVSGTTVVIGARGDDIGGNDKQGSAYVYDCSAFPCSTPNKLTASDGATLDQFGVGLVMNGSTLIIGATGDDVGGNVDQGSAYVFECVGTTCTQVGKVVASDGEASDIFGVSLAIEGNNLVVGAPYHDVDGKANQGVVYLFALLADSTPPIIIPTVTGAIGNGGWYTSDVTINWDVSDSESGISSSDGCGTILLTTDTAGDTLTCSATNGAGFSTTVSVIVKIDKTVPTLTWIGGINEGDSYYFGFVPPEPTCTASDNLSGIDGSCIVSGYASTVGTHTLTATAKDNAGNETTENRNYTVNAWTLTGFYQPVDMYGVYNTVKGGSTVPLKFEIFAGPTELTDVAAVRSLTYAQTSCDATAITDEIETTSTGNTSLRYDETDGHFIYNWKTPKNPGMCYRVTMTTMDGSALAAYFKLK